MATMCQTWSIFTVVLLLAVQLCVGGKSCTIWSSVGTLVQRETSFKVYCSFYCKCKGSMYSGHPPALQSHMELNPTTILFNVVNITKNRTYSCHCDCSPGLDPCGLDISTGYPPDSPKNISCIYKVKENKSGDVFCSWNRGRTTYLENTSFLRMRIRNHTHTLRIPSKGTDSPAGSFPVPTSVQFISVWVRVENALGSAQSSIINYTLSDIETPPTPDLVQPECSSRACTVKVKQQSVRTEHLEIQYTAGGQTWTMYSKQAANLSPVQNITSLEPYTLYHFRARVRFSSGLWSEWSASISNWTQEDTPNKLDVWYAETASDFTSLRVYWKKANMPTSRGTIKGYELEMYNPSSGSTFVSNISVDVRNYSVTFCAECEVKVWARNSKGLSPPAKITVSHTKAEPPQDVRATQGNHSVTISWRKPETAPPPVACVVEWYPEGRKLEKLRWVRLSGSDSHAVITDMKAFECYEGAVHVFYGGNSASSSRFTGVTTQESAPAAFPVFEHTVEGNIVTVTWTELDRGQRMGCITKYTIYLESDNGHTQRHSVPASHRVFIFKDLPPALYNLWMTASTAKGEGPIGVKIRFLIQQSQLSLLLVCGVIFIILLLVCLCQCTAVKQRFQCLMLDVVPDPANSKWAKECTQEKGKMNLQVQLSNSSVTKEEEELILVEVEELPKQIGDTSTPDNVSSQYPSQSALSPETTPATLLYPLTTYIKSLSHDSDSSDHTQTSLDTNTTVDYISSHGPENMGEEDQDEDEDEDEEFAEVLGFFPSHNMFTDQLHFGGKLTLDAVKIDCSGFQNI
ncbi:interleukin-12 receptor subunit beta-2 [Anabas testudineus]|uniref:Fibronectin type-III domain-containing protein n=1 Tax=Anabas testudineus TaxID=64144 RepID=A0A3Q1JTQ7_ANATE|nr:interleukin-12 receptor subunit beta-2 [Anabas testudineus]